MRKAHVVGMKCVSGFLTVREGGEVWLFCMACSCTARCISQGCELRSVCWILSLGFLESLHNSHYHFFSYGPTCCCTKCLGCSRFLYEMSRSSGRLASFGCSSYAALEPWALGWVQPVKRLSPAEAPAHVVSRYCCITRQPAGVVPGEIANLCGQP